MMLISIVDIMHIMKKYCKSGILICIVCILAGFIYDKYVIPTTYINTSKFYVDTKENVEKSKLDLEYIVAAQQLVATYIEIFKSNKVLSKVKNSISYDYTKEQLSNMITCDSINHTAIMKVDVVSSDANAAYEINKQFLKYGEEDYTKEQLSNMITCDSINHTAIMKVDVVSSDANAAYEINKQFLKYGEEEANRVIGNNRMIIIDEPTLTTNPVPHSKKTYIFASIICAVAVWIAYIILRENKLCMIKVGKK